MARYGTFAGAGEHIGLTQSVVSAQIQRLEASLGFQLFDRMGRSATLNVAGRDALVLAESIVAMADRLGEQGGSNELRALVRVGAIASAQASFLLDALICFRAEFPHSRTRILPGVSLDLLGLVDAGEIDLAVLIRPPFAVPADLEWRTPVAEPFVLPAQAGLPGDDTFYREIGLAERPRHSRQAIAGRLADCIDAAAR
ncbi:LysR family transcriptional regulator [Ralstonia pseudosolanacearum]